MSRLVAASHSICTVNASLKAVSVRAISSAPDSLKSSYDVVVVGAGHNGLIAANYLQRSGKSVAVLERRHLVGGAAVTEEIIPGFKFSRCSYLLSLLRPVIYDDLELKKYGLKIHFRNPNSFTPLLEDPPPGRDRPRSLTLGRDAAKNYEQISQFSVKDAKSFEEYERSLQKMIDGISPLLDHLPLNLRKGFLKNRKESFGSLKALLRAGRAVGKDIPYLYELMTGPASKMLDRWFESEPLKATLATDSVIGAMMSPHTPGSGYVLLHHMIGELEGVKGAWGYVEGGMGALSNCIAASAMDKGVEIFVNKEVDQITSRDGKVSAVVLKSGEEIKAKTVLSNATAKVTFIDLIDKASLPEDFVKEVKSIDYSSPVTKINVAVDKLPSFLAAPNRPDDQPLPHHETTIHLNCETTDLIHEGYLAAQRGWWHDRPNIEMVMPSSKDPTLAPPGSHVVSFFTSYTPYQLRNGEQWDEKNKALYVNTVFNSVEQYAPGFKKSVLGVDVLTPPDLERIFGLTGGNIFHGSMSLDQLYLTRPLPSYCDARSPIGGLYICGSGIHPGGGVMGSAGRLAALAVLNDNM